MVLTTPSIALIVSCAALAISMLTAWFTLFRKGNVHSTRPAVIYIGVDGANGQTNGKPKIHFRSLLYCSAKRGQAIDNLSASLTRGDTTQHFTIWVYGDKELLRGSGLFVPNDGLAFSHHFLLSDEENSFYFSAGTYRLVVSAEIASRPTKRSLIDQNLVITDHQARELSNRCAGVYFDWSAAGSRYNSRIQHMIPDTTILTDC